MTNKFIKCPECSTDIEISTVLGQQIENDLKITLQQDNDKKLRKAVDDALKHSQEDFSVELDDMKAQLKEQNHKLSKAREKQLELKKLQRELDDNRKQFDEELNARLKKQETVLREQVEKQAKQATVIEINDLQEQLKEKSALTEQAQQRELDIRKQARQLEEKQKTFDLELQRKLDENRKQVEEKISQQFANETNLKLKEKQKQIDDLRQSLEQAKRKSEQGSMETQGEVLELHLEQTLHSQFIHDNIKPVPKGIKGADVIQEVRDASMNDCGKIIWEAKNTKKWSPQWLQKLKDDQREIGANIAILISVVLPDNINRFAMVDGVWVTDIQSYQQLAAALREQLIQVSFARNASHGKAEKMDVMFNYLSGDEFRQRVEAIVDTFINMQEQLNKEKRAMERIWKEREKQIQRITTNTIGMYGDVRGIIGSSVQAIPALELDDSELGNTIEHVDNVSE
jgi:hypothetical protein